MKVTQDRRSRALLRRPSDFDLRLLQVFKAVVDCGGLTAAELELNIGTSTVSRHLKDLETRLGLVLCRRGRAGFAVTAEGQRIYEEAVRLTCSLDAFRVAVDDLHLRMGGRMDLALFDKTATNPACRVAEAIRQFSDKAPDVELNVHVAPVPAIERGLLDGTFQVGLIPTHRTSRSLEYQKLFGETMLLYCAREHPLFASPGTALTWTKLRAYAFAGLGFHSPNMEMAHKQGLVRRATATDQEAVGTLILSGRYLGFLPDHYAKTFVDAGRMRALSPAKLRYECTFVSVLRRAPAPSRAARVFADCLAAAHSPERAG